MEKDVLKLVKPAKILIEQVGTVILVFSLTSLRSQGLVDKVEFLVP
jgi:hypothetical protein